MSKKVKNSLFVIYTVIVVLILGLLSLTFFMSSQMKREGAASLFGYHFSVMDTSAFSSTLPRGTLVTTKAVTSEDEIEILDTVTYRYTDADQVTHVTCGRVTAIDAVASPASYMITQDDVSSSEIVEQSSILGIALYQNRFLGGCFTFFMSDIGFYTGILLPVGILLISEIVLLVLILVKRRQQAPAEEYVSPHRVENFNVRIKPKEDSLKEEENSSFDFTAVPADKVLPKIRPAVPQPKTPEKPKAAEPVKEPVKPAPAPAPKPENPPAEKPRTQEEELSSALASLMRQTEQPSEPKANEKEPAVSDEPQQEPQKDLMEESSEDIINDILKKLYSEDNK